jgi:hypothetical protein
MLVYGYMCFFVVFYVYSIVDTVMHACELYIYYRISGTPCENKSAVTL